MRCNINFYSRMHRFARIQNVTDDRQTDRQTTQCAKGATDSTVGQKIDMLIFARVVRVVANHMAVGVALHTRLIICGVCAS